MVVQYIRKRQVSFLFSVQKTKHLQIMSTILSGIIYQIIGLTLKDSSFPPNTTKKIAKLNFVSTPFGSNNLY